MITKTFGLCYVRGSKRMRTWEGIVLLAFIFMRYTTISIPASNYAVEMELS